MCIYINIHTQIDRKLRNFAATLVVLDFQTYMLTYIYTHIHIYIHLHTYINNNLQNFAMTLVVLIIQTYMLTYSHIYRYIYTYIYTHTSTYMYEYELTKLCHDPCLAQPPGKANVPHNSTRVDVCQRER